MNPSPELFAKLLPDVVEWQLSCLTWKFHESAWRIGESIHETEYLHLCHLIELELSAADYARFSRILGEIATTSRTSAPWQQRLTALAQVKGVL